MYVCVCMCVCVRTCVRVCVVYACVYVHACMSEYPCPQIIERHNHQVNTVM